MLERSGLERRALLTRALSLAVATVLGLGATGCDAIYGLHKTDVKFPVPGPGAGTFWAWSEIALEGGDRDSVDRATLVDVVLTASAPGGTKDLSFLRELRAEVGPEGERRLVAVGDSFPVGQERVRLDVKYKDDLRPLFATADTIRIEWSGATNPDFGAWPAGGFEITAHLVIDVQ